MMESEDTENKMNEVEEEVPPLLDSPSVISWGRNDLACLLKRKDCQTFNGYQLFESDTRKFISISSNAYHTAAVTATGELYCCGQNDEGQLGLTDSSSVIERIQLVESLGNHRILSVACGLMHTVCVTDSGCAISFGSNESGQLGHSSDKLSNVPPKVVNYVLPPRKSALIITKVACGDLFSLFLTTSGEVFGCGSASFLGNNLNSNRLLVHQAERIEAFVGANIIDITAGSAHALALSTSGELYGWGSNRHYELGLAQSDSKAKSEDSQFHQQIPKHIQLSLNPLESGQIIGINAGYSHTVFWTNKGKLFGTGSNKYGQLALPYPRIETFEAILIPFFVVMAACGANHTIVLCNATPPTKDNQLTRENSTIGNSLARMNSFSTTMLGNEAEASEFSKVFGFGSNSFGQVDSESTASMFRNPVEISQAFRSEKMNRILYVSAGGDQSFAIGFRNQAHQTSQPIALKKQFSSLASKAVVPMNAQSLVNLLNKCVVLGNESDQKDGTPQEFDQRVVSLTLSTVGEIFSSPSLLAGSFRKDSNFSPSALDVEGVEAFYVSLMQLGSHAVARLLGAIQQTITELEKALSSSRELAFPESSMRVFLILWQSPIFANPVMSSDLFFRLLKMIALHPTLLQIIVASCYPPNIFASRLLKPLQEHLDYYLKTENLSANATPLILLCESFSWLYAINQKENFVSWELFHNKGISSFSEQILVKDYIMWKQNKQRLKSGAALEGKNAIRDFFFSDYPYLLSTQAKRRILLAESSIQQQQAQHRAISEGLISGAGFFYPWMVIAIERNFLLQQTLLHIANASPMDLKKPLKVIFIGEEGVDEGGVRKEFFQLLIQQLFNFEYGMFVPIQNSRSIWLNKENHWSKDEYSLVGSLLGLALYNGILLDIHFPSVFYKKLLQKELVFDDLRSVDSELHRGLLQLLNFSPREDIENVFCRTFSVEYDEFGEKKTIELIPNGFNIPVTSENYELYVEKMSQWILTDSITQQFDALYEGFVKVIDPSSLLLLIPEELELLMIGTPHLDFKELEQSAEYVGEASWNKDNPTVNWLWEVVHSLSFEEKQKFLFFVTGSVKAPLGGLKNIGLKVQRMGPDSESLPTAHTCFNILLLPEYSSKEKLENRLRKAIVECEGFGLK